MALCGPARTQPGDANGPGDAPARAGAEGGTVDSGAESAAEPVARSIPVTRFEVQIELEDQLAAGDAAAAAALGARLKVLAEAEFGPQSTAFADTLLLVAEAQKRDGSFESAEDNALQAIEIYRQAAGTFDEALVEPYLALGDVYSAAEDYINAMPAYEEARSISRRASGLLNPDQIEILERMSRTAEGLGEIEDAHDYQRDALTLVERANEPYSPEVIAAAIRYGTWLREHNMFTPEQTLYTQAERAVTEQYGENSIELVPILLARAESFRSQALNHPMGYGALELATEILDRNPGHPRLRAEVYRDIGDWEAAFDARGTDGEAYLMSWAALGEVEDGDALRADWFGETPTRWVLLAARSQRGFSTDPDAAAGTLVIRFTVLPSGLTTAVAVTDADPPGIAEEAFIRQFRASRFRPVIRDGRIVPVQRGFRVEFRYDPKRYD
jgi:hypothetical protein